MASFVCLWFCHHLRLFFISPLTAFVNCMKMMNSLPFFHPLSLTKRRPYPSLLQLQNREGNHANGSSRGKQSGTTPVWLKTDDKADLVGGVYTEHQCRGSENPKTERVGKGTQHARDNSSGARMFQSSKVLGTKEQGRDSGLEWDLPWPLWNMEGSQVPGNSCWTVRLQMRHDHIKLFPSIPGNNNSFSTLTLCQTLM